MLYTSLTVDGRQRTGLPIPPIATSPSCLWSLNCFPYLPGSCLRSFIAMLIKHSYASSATARTLLIRLLTLSATEAWIKVLIVKNQTYDFCTSRTSFVIRICFVEVTELRRRCKKSQARPGFLNARTSLRPELSPWMTARSPWRV